MKETKKEANQCLFQDFFFLNKISWLFLIRPAVSRSHWKKKGCEAEMKQRLGSHSSHPQVLILYFSSLLGFVWFVGMTLFFTLGLLQQWIWWLWALKSFVLQKITDSLHLDSVRMRFKAIWSPGWNKCLIGSFSLGLGSWCQSKHCEFGKIPATLKFFRSNKVPCLNCAEIIPRASRFSH